jgi:hypothetical protein
MIYALSKQTLANGLGSFIQDGEPIKLQTGYMPDYEDIESDTIISEPVTFNGTSTGVIKTEHKLFDEDKQILFTSVVNEDFNIMI